MVLKSGSAQLRDMNSDEAGHGQLVSGRVPVNRISVVQKQDALFWTESSDQKMLFSLGRWIAWTSGARPCVTCPASSACDTRSPSSAAPPKVPFCQAVVVTVMVVLVTAVTVAVVVVAGSDSRRSSSSNSITSSSSVEVL